MLIRIQITPTMVEQAALQAAREDCAIDDNLPDREDEYVTEAMDGFDKAVGEDDLFIGLETKTGKIGVMLRGIAYRTVVL